MKKLLSIVLVLTMVVALCAGCGDSSAPAQNTQAPTAQQPADNSGSAPSDSSAESSYEWPEMTIVINDYNVAGSGPALATQMAADHIEEVSGGKIKCETYYGGTLMESTDSFAGTAEGLADITFYLYTLNSGVCPLHTLFTSYYFREMPDMVGMHKCINDTLDAVPEFREEFMKSNLYEIVAVPTAGSAIEFNDAKLAETIKTPADLKGHLIQSSGYNTNAWATIGVSGMGMPPSEWYSNLERGVVDALTMNLPACVDFGLVDVANAYLSFGNSLGLYASAAGYLANLDSWNSWEPEVQALVKEAFLIGSAYNCERDNELQWEVWESEKAAGKLMLNIPQEDMQPWYDLANVALDLWKTDANALGVDADAIVDTYCQILDDYLANN